MYNRVASVLTVIAALHVVLPTRSAALVPWAAYLPHMLSLCPVRLALISWLHVPPGAICVSYRKQGRKIAHARHSTRLHAWNSVCHRHDILLGHAILYLLTRGWVSSGWQGLQRWKAQCRVPDAYVPIGIVSSLRAGWGCFLGYCRGVICILSPPTSWPKIAVAAVQTTPGKALC